FTVPTTPDVTFAVLSDLSRVGLCMPGATIDSTDGEVYQGRVKVRVGPMTVEYQGNARFTEIDPERRTAVVEAKGNQERGAGTASALISASLHEVEEGTRVHVSTDLAITGKPAQFGRGVIEDIGDALLGQFATCLAATLVDEAS